MTPNAKKLLIGLAVVAVLSGVLFALSRDKNTPPSQRGVPTAQ